MKLAGLLIFLISNQGYWIGGEHGIVTVRAAVEGGLPSADLSWVLMLDGVKLREGAAHLKEDGSDLTIEITPPTPRTRVMLKWIYRVTSTNDKKTLETGEVPINLFEAGMLDGLSAHLRGKSLVVWDRPAGLPDIFKSANIPFTRIENASELLAIKTDVLLIGADMLGGQMLEQSSLEALASSGASVMIFHQTRPDRIMRYGLRDRIAPAALRWRPDHPLLVGFRAIDLQSWIEPLRDLKVLQLPADERALEIGYYPAPVESREPGPIDAVLLAQSVGHGRVVLCEIPMGNWSTDGRSQLFLRNAIDYLLSRPEPTPRPTDRAAAAGKPQTRPTAATLQY